jgi:hypothetical protein
MNLIDRVAPIVGNAREGSLVDQQLTHASIKAQRLLPQWPSFIVS